MFTSQELIAEARFDVARERLARMVADGGLTGVSRDAYEGTLTRLIRVGPFGETPGVSKQVQVRLIGPVRRDGTTTVWLRWEATGPAGGLFPVLDADLQLRSEGLEKTRLTLNGCYRPPLGRLGSGLDRAVLAVLPQRRSAPCCAALPTRSPSLGMWPPATGKGAAAPQFRCRRTEPRYADARSAGTAVSSLSSDPGSMHHGLWHRMRWRIC